MIIKKAILNEEGGIIENDNQILCEIINDKGKSEVKFISKEYLKSTGISDTSLIEITSKTHKIFEQTEFDQKVSDQKENQECKNTNIHRWTENETKYLLQQYGIYFPQIGPYRIFKNRITMFEQISKDLFEKFDIKVTAIQCVNRYKNVRREKNVALYNNKISGNAPSKVPYRDEFEEIKNIDDSLEPEILIGVNHVEVNKKMDVTKRNIDLSNSLSMSDTETSDTAEISSYKQPGKRLKSNTLEEVLREISATAEENRDRRHKEKCDLLLSLFGKSSQNSNSTKN